MLRKNNRGAFPGFQTLGLCLAALVFVAGCGGGGGGSSNQSPTAAFTTTPTSGPAPLAVHFDASSSTDDQGIVVYAWNFGDGATGSGRTTDHTYQQAGTYTVTLSVADAQGATDQISHTVTALGPIAAFTMSKYGIFENDIVSFDASGTTDNAGETITSYHWDFGDGNQATGVQTSHPYSTAGTYAITLTVTDSGGSTDVLKHTLSVVSAGGDPLFGLQWFLDNTGQYGWDGKAGKPGEDIDVTPVWSSCSGGTTCRGEGVYVAVVDDGLEIAHPDLQANVSTSNPVSHNYATGGTDPTPPTGSNDAHGTAVGGIIAARDGNGEGGRGVAPRAGLVGYNLLQNETDANEADAMTRQSNTVSVYSNSWGPQDGTGLLLDSSSLWQKAIDNGVSTGRSGLGSIYVWAGGNGCAPSTTDPDTCRADNSNYDGYANYRGVIAVGAVNDQGTRSSYSEKGANLWISAPGGEFCDTHAIVTTDLTGSAGFNNAELGQYTDLTDMDYTRCMNGTSSAAPMVSGVVALMLQANPNLNWREVRAILAQTARQNDAVDGGWSTNGAGYHVNDNYGFGVVDAKAAVDAATTWNSTAFQGTEKTYSIGDSPQRAIPDNDALGVSDTINVLNSTGISHIEWITVTFSASDHTYSGDLRIVLTHVPTGTQSVLADTHLCQNGTCTAYSGWNFGDARHFGESASGEWKLTVIDGAAKDTGTFQSWKITFYGH